MLTSTRKLPIYICAAAFLIGCQSIERPVVLAATQTPAAIGSATPIVRPTQKVRRTPTLYPTSTLIPTLLWADGISAIPLGNTIGYWSPVDSILMLTNCGDSSRARDAIALASPPVFEPYILNEVDYSCSNNPRGSVEWTPDGTQILFLSKQNEPPSYIPSISIMDRDGSNPHPLDPPAGFWLGGFVGWMNDSTVVISSDEMGGANTARILNINTGEHLAHATIFGNWIEPNATYVAGTSSLNGDHVTAISAQVQPEPVEWYANGAEYGLTPTGSDYDEADDRPKESEFQQWIPGTNRALVAYRYGRINGFRRGTWLAIWDIDTQSVTMLVPDGFYGRVAADGRYLMYLTDGPQRMDSERHPLDNDVELIPGRPPIYIQIYDIGGSTVIFSEAVSQHDTIDTWGTITDFAFAPNSRYAAIVLDAPRRLVVLDIDKQVEVFGIDSIAWKPVWSPDSQRLAFRDRAGNLAVLSLADGVITPITQNAGDREFEVEWAPDSKVMSVSWNEGDLGEYPFGLYGLHYEYQLGVITLP